MNRRAVILALLSAALFGISTPAAKLLLGTIQPSVLAGLLYCGAGIGVAILRRVARPLILRGESHEASLGRDDIPWLSGAILSGGVVGPLLLMFGLSRTEAATPRSCSRARAPRRPCWRGSSFMRISSGALPPAWPACSPARSFSHGRD